MDIESITKEINKWASLEPLVQRAWFYGSRAKNTCKPESDLDIAIELDQTSIPGRDDSDGWSTFIHVKEEWKSKLNETMPFELDLQFYKQQEPIKTYLNEYSILAYEKRT